MLVVLLPEPSYVDHAASGRIATGVALPFLLCLPAVLARHLPRAWLVAVPWLAPWYSLFPSTFER